MPDELPKTSDEHITALAGGANLVDGKPTWEYAESSKDNLAVMIKCCDAELETMKRAKVVAAPFYFERTAILYSKAKQFESEIEVCVRYIEAVEQYYSTVAQRHEADVRKGPRYAAICARLAKARALVVKANRMASIP